MDAWARCTAQYMAVRFWLNYQGCTPHRGPQEHPLRRQDRLSLRGCHTKGVAVGTRGDRFIKLGFWSQLILLALIDWGSIVGFLNEDVAWYHYVGFAVVNIVLLWLTWVMWKWLGPQHQPRLGRAPEEL